jgi:hypothetical protein
MKKKSILNSPRLLQMKKKRRTVVKRKIIVFSAIFVVVLVGLCFVSRIEKININTVEVSGNKVIDTEFIKEIAEKKIQGTYLFVIPKTNFLLFPKNKIIKELNDQYKRLTDIEITVSDMQVLEIDVKERIGLYTWCGESLPTEGVGLEDVKCYFMDREGYIFDQAPYFSGDVYFKFFGPLTLEKEKELSSISDSPAGHYFIPDIFARVVLLEDTFRDMGLRPSALFVSNDTEMEFYLESSGTIATAPKIIFNQNADFIKIAENLDAALSTPPFQTEFKEKYNSLSYIDLRFGNKVYYKFRY